MMYSTMIDFSRVSKQICEMAAGDGGRRFENQVPRLMNSIYPDKNFVQPSSQRVKTDLYEDAGTDNPEDNVNYSVKNLLLIYPNSVINR